MAFIETISDELEHKLIFIKPEYEDCIFQKMRDDLVRLEDLKEFVDSPIAMVTHPHYGVGNLLVFHGEKYKEIFNVVLKFDGIDKSINLGLVYQLYDLKTCYKFINYLHENNISPTVVFNKDECNLIFETNLNDIEKSKNQIINYLISTIICDFYFDAEFENIEELLKNCEQKLSELLEGSE